MDVAGGNGFLVEALSFAALVAGTGAWTGASEQESIDIADTIEALRTSAKTGGWAALA